jgi:hypothetical protein
VTGFQAMRSHEPPYAALAHRMAGVLELIIDSRLSIGDFGTGVNCKDQRQQMIVTQSLATSLGPSVAGLPVRVAAGAEHHRVA